MADKLTKRAIDALEPRESDYFVFDAELKGFAVRVHPTGRKAFLIQYRQGGRTRRVGLGRYGTVTADEARTRARTLLGRVAGGDNPAQEIATDRAAPTVSAVCDRFLAEHVTHKCKPKTYREYRSLIVNNVKPHLGAFKIGDVSRADIARLHHDLRDRPYVANRTLALLSKMFNLVELWSLRPDGSNPCRLIKKYPEKPRERYLAPEELARLGAVLAQAEAKGTENRSAITAIRLLILTGCRMSEIMGLKWEYIQAPYIVLPDSKTGARRIFMDDSIAAVLNGIEREPDNPYVLTGTKPGAPFKDLEPPWQRIRKAAGLGDVRLHDLRHTYASNAVRNGVPLEMIKELLGHKTLLTTMRYAHLADEPVRQAAATVSGSLDALLRAPVPGADQAIQDSPAPAVVGNVVRFPRD